MSATVTCSSCQATLPADAPQGLCPGCLIRAGLGETEMGVDVAAPEDDRRQELEAVLGERLPEYRLLRLLGQGGMGEVWLAEQQAIGRQVAIKVMSQAVAGDPSFAERFHREARAMARLDHPNVVRIFDFGCVRGYYFIVMEYLASDLADEILLWGSLRQAAANSQLGEFREKCAGLFESGTVAHMALRLFTQLCDGVEAAHSVGVIHRDLKPENVLMTATNTVKLADFGLARMDGDVGQGTPGHPGQAAPAADGRLTEAHQVMGTPLYMAPEQRDRPREVDGRADIYALGLILHEMITGRLPEGEPKTGYEDLDAVIRKATDPSPENRYATVAEFRAALQPLAASVTGLKDFEGSWFAWMPWLCLVMAGLFTAFAAYRIGGFPVIPWPLQMFVLYSFGYFSGPNGILPRDRRRGWLGRVLVVVGYNLAAHLLAPGGWVDVGLWFYVLGIILLAYYLPKPRWLAFSEAGLAEALSRGWHVALFREMGSVLPYWAILLTGLFAWQYVPEAQMHWGDLLLAVLTAVPPAVALYRDRARAPVGAGAGR